MKIIKNNLVYNYLGMNLNVPLRSPSQVYDGPTLPQKEYKDLIQSKRSFASYITLHLTNKCNMQCSYCFEDKKNHKSFSIGDIPKLFKFIEKYNDSSFLTIRLFGGEPLLEFELLKTIVNNLKNMNENRINPFNLEFNVFTNGTIYNDKIVDFLNKHSIQLFTSIDCNQKIHDKNRIFRDGSGSYLNVINNVDKFNEECSSKVVVRSVIDPNTPWDLIEYSDNLAKHNIIFSSVEFPWSNKDSNFSLESDNIYYIKNMISKFVHEYLKRIKNKDFSLIGLHPFGKYIAMAIYDKSMLCKHSCGAGYTGMSVTSDGEIYPCHAFSGVKGFKLGSIECGLNNEDILNTFINYSDNSKCTSCPIRYLCMNRCPYDSFVYNNNIQKINNNRCEVQKEIVKASFFLVHEIKKLPLQYRMIRTVSRKLFFNNLDIQV